MCEEDPFGPGGSIDGYVRIGEKKKSEKGSLYPAKLDYFIATYPFKKASDEATARKHTEMNRVLAQLHGEKPQKITIILGNHKPDEVLHAGYAYWPGQNCMCRCTDFKTATRIVDGKPVQVECDRDLCPYAAATAKPKCNPYAILKFRFEHAPVSGGHWRFVTHSWNSIRKLRDNLKNLYDYTQDLNGLEVDLELEFESAIVKDKQTRIPTVRLSSKHSPSQLEAGMGRKFTQPQKVKVTVPVIPTEAPKEADSSSTEEKDLFPDFA